MRMYVCEHQTAPTPCKACAPVPICLEPGCYTPSETDNKCHKHAPKESGGTKHDNGKPDLSLVSKDLMETVARVREFGAKKYDRDNWRKGFKFHRSIAAALRHIQAFKEGEDLDPESGITHIGHAICCLEHLLNDYLHHPENDDRYKNDNNK